jgi:hypothetical protein
MSQDSNYRDPNQALSSVYAADNSSTEATTSHLDATHRVVGGVVRSTDVSNTTDAIPYADLTTARTASHQRISDPASITGDDILMVDGSETTVAVALMNGWLVRDNHSGLLRSPQADGDLRQQGDDANKQQQDDANKQQQDEPNPSLDPESEAIVTNALTHAQGETIGVALSVIENGGAVSEASVGQLAARLGLEPEQARAQIEKVRDAYIEEAVNHTAKTTGTNSVMAREALQAAAQRDRSAYNRAAEEHFSTGRPGYDHLVREYVAELDKSEPDAILNSPPPAPGYSTRWDHNTGQVILRFPDKSEMAWSDAVRLGYIMLNRGK